MELFGSGSQRSINHGVFYLKSGSGQLCAKASCFRQSTLKDLEVQCAESNLMYQLKQTAFQQLIKMDLLYSNKFLAS